jgi:dUTP pyrophosphatase
MADNAPVIEFMRLHPERDGDVPLPRYMSPQAAGMDIFAAVATDMVVERGEILLVPTGFAMALPPGYEAQIRPRSGLAIKHGMGIINAPGTIDADYRGEVKIALINLGSAAHTIRRGDRIAQMVIQRCCRVQVRAVNHLDETERGDGGFGHTGR